jgi:hypothetical protein
MDELMADLYAKHQESLTREYELTLSPSVLSAYRLAELARQKIVQATCSLMQAQELFDVDVAMSQLRSATSELDAAGPHILAIYAQGLARHLERRVTPIAILDGRFEYR